MTRDQWLEPKPWEEPDYGWEDIDMYPQSLISWADDRNTDIRIAEAIHELAKDEEEAKRIWEDPSREEIHEIARRALKNGLYDPHEMQWGLENLGEILDDMEAISEE